LLIGDITSLSHLYELNRGLAIRKNVRSFIYAEHNDDLFADIDHSFPLDCHVMDSVPPETVLENIKQMVPVNIDNTISYNLGHPAICMAIHTQLKNEYAVSIRNLRTKPFWK